MVCVKETATAPRLTLVSRLPSVCTAASGNTAKTCRQSQWRNTAAGQGLQASLTWSLLKLGR